MSAGSACSRSQRAKDGGIDPCVIGRPRSLGSSPCHMLSSNLRDSRRISRPASVTFTQRRDLPPRSGVESLIQDVNRPFCSRRRSVMYTAAGATVLPVRRWISSTMGTP